ncbi:uncharacterized protein LOC124945935 [Impatiens glandulifera]|uniref:uncharacterized protein LOC124945935 n=1 Tax=Impatiens glandulifera TaxID=253017 RepID=UPI001FB153B1|nr:uncharacterized protein LOC124945935 [Impatiens glandulifera]
MASKLLLFIIFLFDVAAFGLAIAAERRRSSAYIKKDSELNYQYCVYNSDISTAYGIGALFLLFASQVLIMIASKCFCCGRALKPTGSRAWAVILFIICWVFFIIAELCLLAGSVRNAYHTKYRTFFVNDPPSCEMLRKGVFAAGAAFVFLTFVFSELYYVCLSKARGSNQSYGGGEAGIGLAAY